MSKPPQTLSVLPSAKCGACTALLHFRTVRRTDLQLWAAVKLSVGTMPVPSTLLLLSCRQGPELVIHQPEGVLDGMNDWCREHHGNSGLTDRVRASTTSMQVPADDHRGRLHAACPVSEGSRKEGILQKLWSRPAKRHHRELSVTAWGTRGSSI